MITLTPQIAPHSPPASNTRCSRPGCGGLIIPGTERYVRGHFHVVCDTRCVNCGCRPDLIYPLEVT